MTEQQIIDNNKLIAKFMGNPLIYDGVGNVNKVSSYIDSKFKVHYYNKSWDWLMPVVDKIESMVIPNLPNKGDEGISVDFIIYYNYVEIKDEDRLGIVNLSAEGEDGNKKLAVYRAVVEFIKWYNKQS